MSALWGVLLGGVLAIAGGVTTQVMQGKRERQRWIMDNKKDEYRELLRSITHTITLLMDNYIWAENHDGTRNVELTEKSRRAYNDTLKVIHSRIFIARDVAEYRIYEMFTDAMIALRRQNNADALNDHFDRIRKCIVELALKS